MKAPLQYKGGCFPEGEVFGEYGENSAKEHFALIYDAETVESFLCCYAISYEGITSKIKIYKMKNITKIAVFVLATSFTIIGCEKDESMTPNNSTNGGSLKSTNNTMKSGGLTGADVIEYDSLLQIDEEPATMDRDIALLMLESSINLNKGNHGLISTHSEYAEFEIDIYSENLGNGYHEVTGADALTYYGELETEVQSAYESSELYAEYASDAYISIVDIVFETNISGSAGLRGTTVGVLIKYNLEPDIPYCSAVDSWKALDRLGYCSGSIDMDAAGRLESFLTNPNCSTIIWNPNGCGWNGVWDVVISSETGFNTSNIWDGTAPSNCISAGALNNTYFPGAITEMQNLKGLLPNLINGGSGSLRDPIDYKVGKDDSQTSSDVAHEITVWFARTWCGPVDPL